MTTRTDTDLVNFQEWAEDGYDNGLLDEGDDVHAYGVLAGLHRSIRETGGLLPSTFDLLGAGFHEFYDHVGLALRQFDRPDLAALVESATHAVDELGLGEDPSPRQERTHRELDQRWVVEGGDRFIDELGRRLMGRSGWEPG